MFLLTVFVSLSLMYQGSIYAYDDGLQHIVPVQHMEQQVVTVTSFGGLIYASQKFEGAASNSWPRLLVAHDSAIAIIISGTDFTKNVTGTWRAFPVTEMDFTLRLPEDKVYSAFRSLNASINDGYFARTLSTIFGSSVTVTGSYSLKKFEVSPTFMPTNPPYDRPRPLTQREYVARVFGYVIATITILGSCCVCLCWCGCDFSIIFCDCDCDCCESNSAAIASACHVPVPPIVEIARVPVELDWIVFISDPIEPVNDTFRRQ